MQKKGKYIFARVVGLVLTMFFASFIILQIPPVQSFLAKKVAEKLQDYIEADISIGRVSVMLPGTLVLRDILIIDTNPCTEDLNGNAVEPVDTFFYAGKIAATVSIGGLITDDGVQLSRAIVEDAGLTIVNEPDLTYGGANIERIFRIKLPEEPPVLPKSGTIFNIRKVKVDNFRFKLKINGMPMPENFGGIDFSDLDAVANIRGHDLKFSDNIMYGTSDYCSVREKSGYRLKNLTGTARVGRGLTLVKDIHVVDPWTDVRLEYFSMKYHNDLEFIDFLNLVELEGKIKGGHVAMASVNYFSLGYFKHNKIDCELSSGFVKGCVNNLKVSDFTFHDLSSDMYGKIDCRIYGLPDLDRFGIEARARDVSITAKGIADFLSSWSGQDNLDLSAIAKGKRFIVNADANGLVDNMKLSVAIKAPEGDIRFNGTVADVIDPDIPKRVSGMLSLNELNLNKILGSIPAGPVTLSSDITAAVGPCRPYLNIDSLKIRHLNLLEGNYSGLLASASLSNGLLKAELSSPDRNLNFDMRAAASLAGSDGHSEWLIDGDVRNVNMDELGLKKATGIDKLALGLEARLIQDSLGRTDASLKIPGIVLESDDSRTSTEDICVTLHSNGENQEISVKSGFLDAKYSGDRPIDKFIEDAKAVSIGRHLSKLTKLKKDTGDYGTYRITAEFHDTRSLMNLIKPGSFIADSTRIRLNAERDGTIEGKLASPMIAFGKNSAKNFDISIDNRDNSLNAFALSREINVGGISVKNAAVDLFARDNTFTADLSFDNTSDPAVPNSGSLELSGTVIRNDFDSLSIDITQIPTTLRFGEKVWKFGKAKAHIGAGDVDITGFSLGNNNEHLFAEGGISSTSSKEFNVNFENFDIGIFKSFLGKDICGTVSGQARLASPLTGAPDISARIDCNGAAVGNVPVGDFHLNGMWNDEGEKYDVSAENTLDGDEKLNLNVSFRPQDSRIDGELSMKEFGLTVIEPFLGDIFSEMGGSLSGQLNVHGVPGNMTINENDARLNDVLLKIGFTGVTYVLNGELDINSEELAFSHLDIKDLESGSGVIKGRLKFNDFKSPSIDASLDVSRIAVFDVEQPAQNQSPYGKLKASGHANVSGPFNNLQIDADVATSGAGDIHVPLNSALIGTTSNLLTFVETVRYTGRNNSMIEEPAAQVTSKLNTKARVRITQDVTAWLEIDNSTGNKMRINGNGDVELEMNPSRNLLSATGTYLLNDGSYHFVLPGLLEKDFNIRNGSSITFTGDIMESMLDITAVHPVRASIATLITDSTSVSTRSLVECEIDIGGKISQPQIKFGVNVPEVDPGTKSQIETALNTEDKVQKQFMALLMLGTFIPAEQSGVVNGRNMLYSNISEIMSGQVNSILQKLDIPVDIGFGYQQDRSGDNIYDVAVSTQLFNNRVVVNGSVGNRKYSSGNSDNSIVGDIDIEIKLDKKGRFRLTVFSHSADEYTSFLDNTQRSGLGVSYQTEFSSFKELIRHIFTSKKKREEEDAAITPELKTIRIEN